MTPNAPDYGHREADRKLIALARRLHLSYRQARISLSEKIEKYLDEFEKQDAEKRALYDSGELSHEDFIKWRRKMIIETKAWRNMSEQLANDMTHQNEIAASMINDTLPDVYAINHNFGTYEAEVGSGIDTTYTMYDKHTVARLLKDNEDLLPHPSVPITKDKRWNRQHIQSAVLQGILTGEPMKDIAKRLEHVAGMTENAAMRNARTAVTGAENAGRIDSYKRAESMGIKMQQVWMATLDGRTRDSHVMLDGERRDVGKEFSNGCRYPGDPKGAPGEIYNCRCTLIGLPEGSTYDPSDTSERYSDYLEEQGMTYEQWKEMHGKRFYNQSFKNYKEPTEKVSNKENINLSAEDFRNAMNNSLNEKEKKELLDELKSYRSSVSGDTRRLAKLLDRLDDIKITSDEPIYRGIGVTQEKFDELLQTYKNGESIKMQSLSWTEDENVAKTFGSLRGSKTIIYIDTTTDKRNMISIRGINREFSAWYDENTKEVLSTKVDEEFEPYLLRQDGDIAYVYVKRKRKK